MQAVAANMQLTVQRDARRSGKGCLVRAVQEGWTSDGHDQGVLVMAQRKSIHGFLAPGRAEAACRSTRRGRAPLRHQAAAAAICLARLACHPSRFQSWTTWTLRARECTEINMGCGSCTSTSIKVQTCADKTERVDTFRSIHLQTSFSRY